MPLPCYLTSLAGFEPFSPPLSLPLLSPSPSPLPSPSLSPSGMTPGSRPWSWMRDPQTSTETSGDSTNRSRKCVSYYTHWVTLKVLVHCYIIISKLRHVTFKNFTVSCCRITTAQLHHMLMMCMYHATCIASLSFVTDRMFAEPTTETHPVGYISSSLSSLTLLWVVTVGRGHRSTNNSQRQV